MTGLDLFILVAFFATGGYAYYAGMAVGRSRVLNQVRKSTYRVARSPSPRRSPSPLHVLARHGAERISPHGAGSTTTAARCACGYRWNGSYGTYALHVLEMYIVSGGQKDNG